MPSRLLKQFTFIVVASLVMFSCKDENLINKTKYDGQKVTNTCQSFTEEVNELIEANSGPAKLRVAEYDNAQFEYLFLEPGQFMLSKDTLYFRLINDLEYEKYLQKGVAVYINASFTSQDHLKSLEANPEGDLGKLIVDRAYYDKNKDPHFLYRLPVSDKVDGKQITLSFSIVQFKKSGEIKKVFCNTVEAPLGPLDPSCCTDRQYEQVKPHSIVEVPELDIKDEKYRYAGFNGTLDLIFPMESVKPADESQLKNVIVNYISKYEGEGFKLRGITIDGYASQGGTIEFNQQLSQARCETIYKDLNKHFEEKGLAGKIKIDYAGRGEDWERFDLLVKTASFTDPERSELLKISSSPADADQKEAQLRKFCGYRANANEKAQPALWKKLVSDVLANCRHTYITFSFDYSTDKMYVDRYKSPIPMIEPELYNVATKSSIVTKFKTDVDSKESMRVLNVLIDDNGNKVGNLFAMRSTYHFAMNDTKKAISDIEAAMESDKDNLQFGLAALSYKTKFGDSYSLSERMRILTDYNAYATKYPNNKTLLANRAVMMDKVGFISGAMAEYNKLISPTSKTAALVNNRGVARLKTNRIVEAEADFIDATKLDKTLPQAYYNLAIVYAWKGLTQKAAEALDKATELDQSLCAEIFKNPAFRVMKATPKFKKFADCK